MLNVTPIMVWVERRGSALIQDRPGPNRVGPFGLFQSFADALKFILKEDCLPAQANKFLYTLAPMFGLIPALTTIAVVPWGRPFRAAGRTALRADHRQRQHRHPADLRAGVDGRLRHRHGRLGLEQQVLALRRHPRLGADDLVRALADAGRGQRADGGRLALG